VSLGRLARGATPWLITSVPSIGHIARAALEAAAWQSREVVDAANEVADVPFTDLRVDAA
jgi:glycerol kinase